VANIRVVLRIFHINKQQSSLHHNANQANSKNQGRARTILCRTLPSTPHTRENPTIQSFLHSRKVEPASSSPVVELPYPVLKPTSNNQNLSLHILLTCIPQVPGASSLCDLISHLTPALPCPSPPPFCSLGDQGQPL